MKITYICSFNQLDKKHIKEGFKNKFELENIMTGKELCDLLNIDYYDIIENRKTDMKDNINYFIDELIKIDEVKDMIIKKLQETSA